MTQGCCSVFSGSLLVPRPAWPRTQTPCRGFRGWALICCECGAAEQVRTLTGHSRDVQSVAFSSNGERIISGSDDGFVKLWDAVTGAEVRSFVFGRALSVER